MQVGTLKHSAQVENLHRSFKELFDFVKSNDFDSLPPGRIDVRGDEIFINNVNPEGVAASVQPLEMHREYIDVHILLGGQEQIGWKPIEDIEHYSKEYSAEGDCALSDDAPQFYVTLRPGQFCIVFPEDPHAPAIGQGRIRKLIGKVKL